MALPELFANDLAGTGIATLGAAVATTGVTSITTLAAAPAALQASGQFRIVIDSEVMIVTAGAATTTWTVTRGAEGTTAATHANSATIYHAVTAGGIGAALTGAAIDYASATAFAAGQVVKRNGQMLQALVPIVSTWAFHQARWLPLGQKPRGVLGTGLVPISNRYGRWDTGAGAGGASQSNGTDNEGNSRIAHTALYDTEAVYVEYTLPSSPPNDLLINASIEYPAGTYRALSFGGKQTTWLTVEGELISDPMPMGIRAGEQFWVKTHYMVPAVHAIAITGTPTGGTFTLTNNGKTTAAIARNATFQAVKDAVIAAGLLGMDECLAQGGPLPGSTVFLSTRQLGPLPAAMTHTDALTGGTTPAVAPTVSVGWYASTFVAQQLETGDNGQTGVNVGDTTRVAATGGVMGLSAMAALYQPPGRSPVVSVIGDSIMSCYLANAASSWVRRSLNIPVAHATLYGETLSNYVSRTRSTRRPHAMAGNWLINTLGINDIVGAATLATMQANYMLLWDRYANDGVRVLQASITPKSSSSDVWATVVNQTAFAQNAVRQQLNAWLRDGAPIDATTRAAVATGTVTNVYRAGEGTHPLTATANFSKGCVDVCQTVENDPVAQDSKWVVGYTNDGLHMLETGHQAVATAFQANLQADIV